MIQELLGVSSGFISTAETKISINAAASGVLAPPNLTPSPSLTSPTTTTTSTAVAAPATSSNSENQNLRCPRCDSSNTKFCYYNNYNLTQPRHFCKTCRRYWTKGGALRNVPIGGGCRKNKGVGMSPSSMAKSTTAAAKMKTVVSEVGSRSSGLGVGGGGLDHQELPASPILWGSPQNSQLLALLRANHNQNPNPSPSPSNPISNINAVSVTVKEEAGSLMGSHMVTEPVGSNGLLNGPRSSGFDPSLGLTGSFWRNNNQDQLHQQNGGFVLGEHQNSGIQELYQRLRSSSSANYCSDDSSALFLGNMASASSLSSSSSSLAILESAPVGGGGIGLGYWNQPLSWSDPPTTNGASAYP